MADDAYAFLIAWELMSVSSYFLVAFEHHEPANRHADTLLVTGPVSRHMEAALWRTYAAMGHPKWVIAAGQCACDGGEFGVSYASLGAVENVLPVDVKIPGCPPSPQTLLAGLLALTGDP